MDILAAIKQDHKQIVTLLSTLGNLNDIQNFYNYFNQLSEELETHLETKQQVFYPVVRQNYPNGSDLVITAEAENRKLKQLLEELETFSPLSPEFKQKTTELTAAIQSCFQQEEKNILLPAKTHLDENQMQQLGAEYITGKKQL